jgi:hypothetical protein
MDFTKQDSLEIKYRFYEKKLNEYKDLLMTIEGKDIPKFLDLIKEIDESFTKNIYAEAAGIYEEFCMYKENFEQTKDFAEFVKRKGKLTVRMAQLEANYLIQAEKHLKTFEVEVARALKNKQITDVASDELRKAVKKLSLSDYYTNTHAIVIGINHYKNEIVLTNALNDAKGVAGVLKEKYDFHNIIQLYDGDATKTKIQYIIDDVLQGNPEIHNDDRVLLYFSGHGKLRIIEGYGGEQIKQGYLLPVDAEKDSYSSYIKMDDVIRACQNCVAKHVLLILDCCYSGYAAMKGAADKEELGGRSTEIFLGDITSRKAIQVLAASQSDQPASDSGLRPGYSAFTGALLEVLEQSKDVDEDGLLTAAEIGLVLRAKVAEHLGSSSNIQIPVYTHVVGSGMGDFVFKIFKND